MLPLQAHGYRSGLSASPGFLQILQTSSSSSSSSTYLEAVAVADAGSTAEKAVGEVWLEAEREEDEGEDTDDSDAASAAAPEMESDSDSAEEISMEKSELGLTKGSQVVVVPAGDLGETSRLGESYGKRRRPPREIDWFYMDGLDRDL